MPTSETYRCYKVTVDGKTVKQGLTLPQAYWEADEHAANPFNRIEIVRCEKVMLVLYPKEEGL